MGRGLSSISEWLLTLVLVRFGAGHLAVARALAYATGTTDGGHAECMDMPGVVAPPPFWPELARTAADGARGPRAL